MRRSPGVVGRAQQDIEAGRLWKARDRLFAAVRERPTDQEVLDALGEVHFLMGDQPAAGRFWLLTERTGDEMEMAMAAFEERWEGSLGEKLKVVPFSGKVEDYPPKARERLHSLEDQALRSGIEWPKPKRAEWTESAEDAMGPGGWVVGALLLISGPGLWLLGIAAAIYLLVGWLF